MKLDPTNKRVFPIAVGSKFSYSWYPADAINEYPLAIGEELVLVAGLQARNNARIVIAGSYAMFSDKFQANNAAQADFVKSVLLWATKNAGVLRPANMKHFRVGESDTPSFYTIEETIRFETQIEFKLPDTYGVFQFRVNYERLEYTTI